MSLNKKGKTTDKSDQVPARQFNEGKGKKKKTRIVTLSCIMKQSTKNYPILLHVKCFNQGTPFLIQF